MPPFYLKERRKSVSTRVQSADLIGSKLLPEVNDGVGSVHADREVVHDGCDPFP